MLLKRFRFKVTLFVVSVGIGIASYFVDISCNLLDVGYLEKEIVYE